LRLAGARHGALQGVGKVDVARLEIRRIRVGDVRRQQLLALRTQAERHFIEAQVVVEFADHGCSRFLDSVDHTDLLDLSIGQ
jgi:hypothetical protein